MYKPRVTKPSDGRLPKMNITPRISPTIITKERENKSPNTIEILKSALNRNLSFLLSSVSVIVSRVGLLALAITVGGFKNLRFYLQNFCQPALNLVKRSEGSESTSPAIF